MLFTAFPTLFFIRENQGPQDLQIFTSLGYDKNEWSNVYKMSQATHSFHSYGFLKMEAKLSRELMAWLEAKKVNNIEIIQEIFRQNMEHQLFLQVSDCLCLAITKESGPPIPDSALIKINSILFMLTVSPAGSVCLHFI